MIQFRQQLLRAIISSSIALVFAPVLANAQSASSQPDVARAAQPAPVSAVAGVSINVGDLDKAIDFYTRVLDFEVVTQDEAAGTELERVSGVFGARCRVATMRLGAETLWLTEFLAPEGAPLPQDSRSNDRWFQHIAIVVSDMDAAYRRLRDHNARHASSGPQTLPDWNLSAGGISAFYFKDPEGHVLEVIHFPPGKGDARWQSQEHLFLGIDHAAIVVESTERSLGFYRDTLGLRIAGTSENYGIEQERLNNVFGARLRITALRAASGPGVELLEYLAPDGGREYPESARPNDLIHWRTIMTAPDVDPLTGPLRASEASWISPGVVSGAIGWAAFAEAAHVRDPDGHAVVIGASSNSGATP
jgi:catechol 2,3-dioxygenase-like lactoylglutathione lyase family enzyme